MMTVLNPFEHFPRSPAAFKSMAHISLMPGELEIQL
jgi:hypothetical protein